MYVDISVIASKAACFKHCQCYEQAVSQSKHIVIFNCLQLAIVNIKSNIISNSLFFYDK